MPMMKLANVRLAFTCIGAQPDWHAQVGWGQSISVATLLPSFRASNNIEITTRRVLAGNTSGGAWTVTQINTTEVGARLE
jgi:hypothetical protein